MGGPQANGFLARSGSDSDPVSVLVSDLHSDPRSVPRSDPDSDEAERLMKKRSIQRVAQGSRLQLAATIASRNNYDQRQECRAGRHEDN